MRIRESNKSILFLLLIFIAILFLSIGYCNINDLILTIKGDAVAEAVKMLVIESVEIDNDTSTAGGAMTGYSNDSTLLQISSLSLPTENVTEDTNVTVLVKVRNLSDTSYEFNGIRYLRQEDLVDFPSFSVVNDNPNIKIDETSFEDLKGKIIEATSIDGTGIMTIPIRFKYVDITNIENNVLNISIKLNFYNIERKTYKLKTGRDFYSAISSHYSDATKIQFCAKTEVPTNSTKIGEAGINDGEIKAYWNENGTIYIAADTKNATIVFNEDSGYMFSNGNADTAFSKVTTIEVSNNVTINTANTTQFEEMFKGCSSLTSSGIQGFLDLLDTRSAVNMCAMFGSTKSITKLNLTNFNTENVTDMSWMFEQNSGLISITFGENFSTANVRGTKENQGFAGMFQNCTSLKSLDLSNFDTSNVVSMWYMFSGCSSLEKIYVSDAFVTTGLSTEKIPNSTLFVFKGCEKLVGGSGTTYSSTNIGAEYAHIDGGTENPGYFSQITEFTVTLDANGGKFPNGRTKKTYNAKNSIILDLNEPITNEDKKLKGWSRKQYSTKPEYAVNEDTLFYEGITLYAVWEENATYSLESGPKIFAAITNYKAEAEHVKFTSESNVPETSTLLGNLDENGKGDIKGYYNETTKTVYISAKEDASVIRFNKDSSHMFSNGKNETDAFNKLQTIDVEGVTIDTGYVEDFAEIFKYNKSITQDSMQAFINMLNTSEVKNMCAMFEYLGFSTIDVSSLDTSNVTDMSWMFHGGKFTNIILGDNFDTGNVKNYDGMFQELPEIEVLDISQIRVKEGSRMDYTFGKCPKLKTIYVSKDTKFYENTYTGTKVFENDVSLIGGVGKYITKFDSENTSREYARISAENTPGYFTDIEDKKR